MLSGRAHTVPCTLIISGQSLASLHRKSVRYQVLKNVSIRKDKAELQEGNALSQYKAASFVCVALSSERQRFWDTAAGDRYTIYLTPREGSDGGLGVGGHTCTLAHPNIGMSAWSFSSYGSHDPHSTPSHYGSTGWW